MADTDPSVRAARRWPFQTRHVVRLVDDLLDVSRVMTGKIPSSVAASSS